MDALVEALWPDDSPDIARHKLHVAVSALRRALNGQYARQKEMGYLLYENGAYRLNPDVAIRIDAAEFLALYRTGQHARGNEAIPHFEAACRLYTGPFLPEDLYADWSLIYREQLTQIYLTMCNTLAAHYLTEERNDEAAGWARCVLEENRCDEAAHRQLMRAYAAQGRRSEALRQYQRCEHVLGEELGVQPMPETKAVFQAILHGEALPKEDEGTSERMFHAVTAQEARSA
jgi:DNA-binding SARP family transcriptional activator